MHSLRKEFLPPTLIELSKINFGPKFLTPSSGRQRKEPKLNTKAKKFPLIGRHLEVSFFKPKQNFLSIHPYRTQKNQFCLKVFTSSLISWEIF